jgi:hypothetical protein
VGRGVVICGSIRTADHRAGWGAGRRRLSNGGSA